ncbi:7235_t:CDS:2, partial [Dentiscutata erythropus]
LWGNPSHMQYLMDQLIAKYKDKIHILNAKHNTSDYTYDGIDICGERLVKEINDEVNYINDKNLYKISKISFVGYSLGGLIARYAIGVLYNQGFFNEIDPTFFTTIATPHLGIRRDENKLVVKIVGEQLNYKDRFDGDEPILSVMSSPEKVFYKALTIFKYRKLYANTRNDRTVPFWTAAIADVDPFEDLKKITIEKNEKFGTLIKSISKQVTIPAKVPWTQKITNITKSILYCLLIGILLPLWIIIVLSTLTVQGLISRRRVAKILAARRVRDSNWNITSTPTRSNVIVSNIEEDAAETVINIQNILTHSISPSPTKQSPSNKIVEPSTNTIMMTEFTTSSLFPRVPICGAQNISFTYLNMLGWEKFVVIIDSLNSHASIIMRNKRFGEKGKEVIKHFIEEVFIP